MSNKIKVKVWRIENAVLMKVLDMPEELRNEKIIYISPSIGMKIKSYSEPDLSLDSIFVWGNNKKNDNKIVVINLESITKAIDYYNNVINTIEEFNDNWNRSKNTIINSNYKDDTDIDANIYVIK